MNIRRILATCTILAGLAAAPAHAAIPTIDVSEIEQTIALLKQQISAYAVQIQQLEQAAQSVQWAANTFDAFVAHPGLGQAMGLMGQLGISDPLPVNPYAVQSLMNGYGGISGTLGSLSGLANTSWGTNHVYSSTDGTWTSQQSMASANGIAGAQGIAGQVYQQMADHFAVLGALRQDLLGATTPAERDAAMGQLAAEQAWTQNAQGQLQAAQIMLLAQRDSRAQREDEQLDQSIDGQLSQARAQGLIP